MNVNDDEKIVYSPKPKISWTVLDSIRYEVEAYRDNWIASLKDDDRIPLSVYNGVNVFLSNVLNDLRDMVEAEKERGEAIAELEDDLRRFEESR